MSSYSKKIHSFKSLVDECMWLIKVVQVFFLNTPIIKNITSFYKYEFISNDHQINL